MPDAALLEILLGFGGFLIFYIWQRRSLARDIRAREERERLERENRAQSSEEAR
ncbi:hypothetical protein [Roseibium sp. RKSG952]|uniref:hypothetical protein n=1 Tax=Roseibium sp. RKSG952 TaxID=2529384 RepID=UPI0012BBE842|nr:hypothetical protein [Roseibium sp. RKSG952]